MNFLSVLKFSVEVSGTLLFLVLVLIFTEVWLLCGAVLVSTVRQSEPAVPSRVPSFLDFLPVLGQHRAQSSVLCAVRWFSLVVSFTRRWCLVPQLCLSVCDPRNCSTLGSPVLHHLLEFAQIHVH